MQDLKGKKNNTKLQGYLSIIKGSHDFLLYTKKEKSRVLFHNKIWLLILPPA